MNNLEVVNFVEKFRLQTHHESAFRTHKGKVGPADTTIAHLLCEEARHRWIGICCDEDVMIDDISCVVLEFPTQPLPAGGVPIPDRAVRRAMSLGPEDDPSEIMKGKHVDSRGTLVDDQGPDHLITLSDMAPRSPQPSSSPAPLIANDRKSMKPTAVRNDFLRGSIARDRSDQLEEVKESRDP